MDMQKMWNAYAQECRVLRERIAALRQALEPYVDIGGIDWLRFPGGSTNTVSRRYGGKGLMQQLKNEVEQRGWQWVDWNVCAEDATASHPDAAQILRNIRRDAMDKFKAQKKKSEITEDDLKIIEKDLQKLTDDYIKEVERIADEKEKELMEI